MVEKVLERQRIPFEPYGATTWQRPDLLRGLEADECYYVQSVPRIAGRIELDLTIDPPPDLAIEVEVASPLLDKVAVYGGLGVPELWRVRADGSCDMFRLDTAGAYQPIGVSVAVPPFTPAVLSQYLRLRAELSYSAAMARFEAAFLPTVAGPAVP
jgi:Uma2 family endonuclease